MLCRVDSIRRNRAIYKLHQGQCEVFYDRRLQWCASFCGDICGSLQSLVRSRSCLWLLFLRLEKQMRLFPSSQDLLRVQVRLKFQQIQIKQGTECWILPDHADRRWTTMTTLTTLTRTHVRLVTLPQKLEVIATCQAELLNAPLPREWLVGQSPVTQVG